MRTIRFVKFSFLACLTGLLLTTIADAQPPEGGQRGRRGEGQRGEGQRGEGQRGEGLRGGGQRGFGQRGGFPGGPGGMFGGPPSISRAQLLGSEDVQTELNVGEGQGVTITAALAAYRDERSASRPDYGSLRDLPEEERRAAFEKMRKDGAALNKALNEKTDELLNALLEPEQAKRLDQIAIQVNARTRLLAMMKEDDMRDKLSVKEEQLEQLDELEKATQEAQAKRFQELRANRDRNRDRDAGDGGERPDPREAFEKARAEMEAKVMAILTDEQKVKFKELKGEAFEFDLRSLMRGGGRGGFGGGRSRGGGDGNGNQGGGERRRPAADTDEAI